MRQLARPGIVDERASKIGTSAMMVSGLVVASLDVVWLD